MKTLLIICLLSSCAGWDNKPSVILSPQEKVHYIDYGDFLSLPTHLDTIRKINGFCDFERYWIVASDIGIYFIDKHSEKIEKYFQFHVDKHSDLFSSKDSSLGFLATHMFTCSSLHKVLFMTTNGLVFQVDSKSLEVDWLFKIVHRVKTAQYSNKGDVIAIGTDSDFRYDDETEKGKTLAKKSSFGFNACLDKCSLRTG